jgi:hypothetical protein
MNPRSGIADRATFDTLLVTGKTLDNVAPIARVTSKVPLQALRHRVGA